MYGGVFQVLLRVCVEPLAVVFGLVFYTVLYYAYSCAHIYVVCEPRVEGGVFGVSVGTRPRRVPPLKRALWVLAVLRIFCCDVICDVQPLIFFSLCVRPHGQRLWRRHCT